MWENTHYLCQFCEESDDLDEIVENSKDKYLYAEFVSERFYPGNPFVRKVFELP